MSKIKYTLSVGLVLIILIIFADTTKVKGQIEPKFKFGELVKIRDFPDSQTFKIINYCDEEHSSNVSYEMRAYVPHVDYLNYHLLNSLGQEIIIAEFNLVKKD